MICVEDYLYFAERALNGIAGIVLELGDDDANRRAYPGANTPYAVLHHSLAVVETWVGGFVRGCPVERDRHAEFDASGQVAALATRTEAAIEQLRADVIRAEPNEPLTREPPVEYQGPGRALTQGGALQHVYEELAQHHGQVEILRDVLGARG